MSADEALHDLLTGVERDHVRRQIQLVARLARQVPALGVRA